MSLSTDTLIGTTIDDRYTVTHRIGCGGMGAVYSALQRPLNREVAIKVIHPELGSETATARRFLREAWWSARVQSPQVVSVYDFGRTGDGLLFMAMELVGGETVAAELRHGPIDPVRAARIAMQVCLALEAAHRLDVVHRDLKPANIMVGRDPAGDLGEVKVLDFGLAKSMTSSTLNNVTEAGFLVGTSSYLAPELIRGDAPTPTSDLYSLGAVLYTMLAGRRPFVGDALEVMRSHVLDEVPTLPAAVPSALAAVVMQLLEKSPDKRFQSAEETRLAIARALSGPSLPPPVPMPVPVNDSASASGQIEIETEEIEVDDVEFVTAIYEPRPPPQPRRKRPVALILALVALVAAVAFSCGTGLFAAPQASASQTSPVQFVP